MNNLKLLSKNRFSLLSEFNALVRSNPQSFSNERRDNIIDFYIYIYIYIHTHKDTFKIYTVYNTITLRI
jgi:hypothetical protein